MFCKTKILNTFAVLGVTTALAAPATAMTCVEFVDMSDEDRMKAVEEMDMGGRLAARQEARGDDPDASGDAVTVDSDDSATDGGRENARDFARGEDVVAQIIDDCARSSEMDLDSLISPTQ